MTMPRSVTWSFLSGTFIISGTYDIEHKKNISYTTASLAVSTLHPCRLMYFLLFASEWQHLVVLQHYLVVFVTNSINHCNCDGNSNNMIVYVDKTNIPCENFISMSYAKGDIMNMTAISPVVIM